MPTPVIQQPCIYPEEVLYIVVYAIRLEYY
jgi:hypothetical protein